MSIRGLDPDLYQKVRVFAVQRGITVGEALNIMLKEYFESKASEPKPEWRQPRA